MHTYIFALHLLLISVITSFTLLILCLPLNLTISQNLSLYLSVSLLSSSKSVLQNNMSTISMVPNNHCFVFLLLFAI